MTGICFCGNFQQIQDYERGIVLRHGKRLQKQALAGGMHYIIPGVDDLMKVDIRERPLDVPRQGVLTREGTLLQIDGVVHFKIFDADKALLTTQDYRKSIKLITITKLREILALYTFEQIQRERQRIASSLKAILDEASAPWGVDITRVELTEIILPPSLQNAMNAQKTAERTAVSQLVDAKSRAEVAMVDAKGASGAMTVSAEAIAKAKLIEAQGEKAAADDFKSAADIMSANPVSLSVQYLQTLQNLGATGTNNTVVLPFDTDNYSILSKNHQKSQKASRA